MIRTKYRNQPTVVDGRRFSSKKEARRYSELRLMLRAGYIHDLELQPPFKIEINGIKVCRYVSDFSYWESVNGGKAGPFRRVVEDTKGYKTPEYRLKKKLMLAVLGIDVRET